MTSQENNPEKPIWVDNDSDLQPGDVGFVLYIQPHGREDRTVIRTKPGRTNQSNARRITGWLGTTDNIATYAEGVGLVQTLSPGGDRALVRVLTGNDLDAALEILGHPDLHPDIG